MPYSNDPVTGWRVVTEIAEDPMQSGGVEARVIDKQQHQETADALVVQDLSATRPAHITTLNQVFLHELIARLSKSHINNDWQLQRSSLHLHRIQNLLICMTRLKVQFSVLESRVVGTFLNLISKKNELTLPPKPRSHRAKVKFLWQILVAQFDRKSRYPPST